MKSVKEKKDKVRAVFDTIVQLEDENWQKVNDVLILKSYKKNEIIVKDGEVCRHVFFLSSGIVRFFYEADGKEHVKDFCFEGNFFSNYSSFLTGEPSKGNIQALSDCEAILFPYSNMQQLYKEEKQFERIGRVIAENLYINLVKRVESLLMEKPEERYEKLFKDRPKVIQMIPQYMIASYLGVTPEALSRIRKRMIENRELIS